MSGSIRKVWIDGTTFFIKATSDLTESSDREVEGIKHSGGTIYKTELKVPEVDGFELIIEGEDKIILNSIATEGRVVEFGYKEEDGTVNNARGKINIDGRTTMEATTNVKMIPNVPWEVTFP